jgi:hypothetical protein
MADARARPVVDYVRSLQREGLLDASADPFGLADRYMEETTNVPFDALPLDAKKHLMSRIFMGLSSRPPYVPFSDAVGPAAIAEMLQAMQRGLSASLDAVRDDADMEHLLNSARNSALDERTIRFDVVNLYHHELRAKAEGVVVAVLKRAREAMNAADLPAEVQAMVYASMFPMPIR